MQALGRAFGRIVTTAIGVTVLACEAFAAGGAFVVDDAVIDEPGAC